MFEATTNRTIQNAMHNAHKERARAMQSAWEWLFSAKSR